MDGYERIHPPGGYGLGRHAPVRPPPEQSAQALATGAPGVQGGTAPAPAAPDATPAGRARALLSSRRPAAPPDVRPPPAPSLAAPPATPPPTSPLAPPPPPAPASSPLAAPPPAPPPPPAAAPNQWGIDFSTPFTDQSRPVGWSDTMERLYNPARAGNSDAAWAADPRSNPNNAMGVFYDQSKKQGDVSGYYNDFLNPALRVSPGGQQVSLEQAGIKPGSVGDPTWNPAPAQPAPQPWTSPDADQALLDYEARTQAPPPSVKPPPIVDSIPPPDQLPPSAGDDSAGTAAALAAAQARKGATKTTGPVKTTYFTGGR